MEPICEFNGILKVEYRSVSEIDATMLVKWVNESTTITTLNLHSVKITDDVFKTMCDGITNPRLTTFKSYKGRIGNEGIKRIATKLPNLTTLVVTFDSIANVDEMITMTNLETLDLCRNKIGEEGVMTLSTMPNLKTLFLSRCSIDDKGAIALSKLQKSEELRLYGNEIGNEGAIALSKIPNLRTLDLSRNEIGKDGAIALSTMPNLETLYIFANDIDDEGAIALLTKSPKLTTLDLRRSYRIENPDALFPAFDAHPTLFDLRIDAAYGVEDYGRVMKIQNRKRTRAFCESVKLEIEDVKNKIFKYL